MGNSPREAEPVPRKRSAPHCATSLIHRALLEQESKEVVPQNYRQEIGESHKHYSEHGTIASSGTGTNTGKPPRSVMPANIRDARRSPTAATRPNRNTLKLLRVMPHPSEARRMLPSRMVLQK